MNPQDRAKPPTVRTSVLKGPQLDYAVAASLNKELIAPKRRVLKVLRLSSDEPAQVQMETKPGSNQFELFNPTTDWALAGRIMTSKQIAFATVGNDPLMDAMRAYVFSIFGEEITLPISLA